MRSSRPYLVRALIDWIADSDCTPYVVIATDAPGTEALRDYATDDRLVLNLSATATRNLRVDNDGIEVDCRFGGRAVQVRAPIGAVAAVYARENGMGMAFDPEAGGTPAESKPRPPPKLSLVK